MFKGQQKKKYTHSNERVSEPSANDRHRTYIKS
jgi:hypothetical protein